MTKLYTGDNAKYLVGDKKIPVYLTRFLANMDKGVHEFKINSVRLLRMSSEKLMEICQIIPNSVFFYLNNKYTSIITNRLTQIEMTFAEKHEQDKITKSEHMQAFRPNLENPANKEDTEKLNQ